MAKDRIQILYQDGNIIVVNKPAGVSVTKDRTGRADVVHLLRNQLALDEESELRLVHRLDKDASGAMILARNLQAQSRLSSYFEKRLVKKTYLALVRGVSAEKQGTIRSRLAHNRKNPQLMCIDPKRGKAAVTEWRVLADFGAILLLAVYPLTGRTHQIRVHLQSVGLPLAVDGLYGGSAPIFLSEFKTDYRLAKEKPEKPLIDRLTLHCYELEVLNCPLYEPSNFAAPLDRKFAAAIKMLTKHNPKGPDAFLEPANFSKIINNERLC